ncbi:hypothetical protein BH23GEM9_BH23GEM9_05230 [soil metagenome]
MSAATDGAAPVPAAPRDVALRVLSLRVSDRPTSVSVPRDLLASTHHAGLAEFQREALSRLRTIIQRRRGAILADSVGLGKTHVAAALLSLYLDAGRSVLVCGPAQLGAHWRRQLRRLRGWTWLSHTSLSRGRTRPHMACGLIVVDEAHAFRNPATRRYAALTTMTDEADVLLMTATPVNNSVLDFYHLVRLFAGDDAFVDIGVLSLESAAEAAARGGSAGPVRRVAEEVMVRRTRDSVRSELEASPYLQGRRLAFPRQEAIRTVQYDFRLAYPDLTDAISGALAGLTFPVHALGRYAVDGAHFAAPPTELLRLNILKRLESSTAAFRTSIVRHRRLVEQFLAAAADGYILNVADHHLLYRDIGDAVQLPIHGAVLRPWPTALDRATTIQNADDELRRLRLLKSCVANASGDDPKIVALQSLLDGELAGETTLIFTEFRETAVLLWRTLSPRGGVGLIHGGDARLGRGRTSRGAVIDRFAPIANRARVPRPHERVRLLIATDVLAEGINLQDARVVISYDMPWNPVRLAQRIGRIDRLGSPHDAVLAYTFMPDRDVDSLLRLLRRVRRKLRAIGIVGGDAPRFGASVSPALNARNADPEQDRDLQGGWDLVEALRTAWRRGVDNAADRGDAAVFRPADRGIIAAAIRWRDPHRGALCAVSDGGRPWLVLVRGREPPRLQTQLADELLLQALSATELLPLDDAWVARAMRRAIAAVHLSGTGPGARVPERRRTDTRAAAAVRRWLRSADHATDAAAIADADRALALLALPQTSSLRLRIGDVLRSHHTDDERVRALADLATERKTPQKRRPAQPPRLRVVAVLELVPEGSGGRRR